MKLFAIFVTSAGEMHVANTETNSPPRKSIIGEADTYQEAIDIRDAHRHQIEERKAKSDERWHRHYDNAMEQGNLREINRLCGIRY